MEPHCILLVDDEPSLVEAVRFQLEQACYRVLVARNGVEGLQIARTCEPCLILLDINLPGLDGLEVCQSLRRDGFVGPIVLLTARDDEVDKIVGLEVGADDYVTKPFSTRELLARVKAHLRRERRGEGSVEVYQSGGLCLNATSRTCEVQGSPVTLSQREFDLMLCFLQHPGQVLTRTQLVERVWGYDFDGEERVVNVTVGRLREKLRTEAGRLATVRGVGYRFEGS